MVQLRERERERDSANERGESGFGEGAIAPHLQLPVIGASPCLVPGADKVGTSGDIP